MKCLGSFLLSLIGFWLTHICTLLPSHVWIIRMYLCLTKKTNILIIFLITFWSRIWEWEPSNNYKYFIWNVDGLPNNVNFQYYISVLVIARLTLSNILYKHVIDMARRILRNPGSDRLEHTKKGSLKVMDVWLFSWLYLSSYS